MNVRRYNCYVGANSMKAGVRLQTDVPPRNAGSHTYASAAAASTAQSNPRTAVLRIMWRPSSRSQYHHNRAVNPSQSTDAFCRGQEVPYSARTEGST